MVGQACRRHGAEEFRQVALLGGIQGPVRAVVKNNMVDAAVSAGNTGALLASSLFLIGKIPGVRRPAFAPFIPSKSGGFILCDAGVNADSKPQHLVQFALMACAYMEHLENRPNPRVALLNIGSEESKGNELTTATYPI